MAMTWTCTFRWLFFRQEGNFYTRNLENAMLNWDRVQSIIMCNAFQLTTLFHCRFRFTKSPVN